MPENILQLLKGKAGFISGQEISDSLGITRAAVWKKIKKLRNKGFIIIATPSKGYKLINSPDLSKEEIEIQVQGDLWKNIIFYQSVDSTNEIAMLSSAKNDTESGTIIIADRQEKGKGRLGRTWISPPGLNIYMSIILRPEIEPKDATLLTVLTSIACALALRGISGLKVVIKWPNDLMVSEKKLGGILTEVRSEPERIKTAVIGIGINVNIENKDFPAEIRDIATSIKNETGKYLSRSEIIIRILKEFEAWFNVFKSKGSRPLLEKWKQLSSTLGKNVKVAIGDSTVSGLARDIDEEGMLILELKSGSLRKISAGDVTILR